MSSTRIRNIKILGWITALASSLAAFISGDIVSGVGIIGAAAASANVGAK